MSSRKDTMLLFKSFFSVRQLVGVGLLLSLFLPQTVVVTLALGCLLQPGVLFLLKTFELIPDQDRKNIHKGRFTAKIEGDFVVFLIGSRPNGVSKAFTSEYKNIGDAMATIQKELKEKPELGCLGTESYIGDDLDGSRTLLVQYWRSAESLEAYASSQSNAHHSPWKMLMNYMKKSDNICFWHETYKVRAGEYEAIYVNGPLFGLAKAHGVQVLPALHQMTTMKGRLGKGNGDANEWPEGYMSNMTQ